jgi:hypothetical protein
LCGDLQVKAYQNDLKKHFLIDLHKLLIPLFDIGRTFTGVGFIIVGRRGVTLVMLTPLDNLLEDSLIDLKVAQDGLTNCNLTAHRGVSHIGDRNGLFDLADILEHVLD